MKKILAVVLGTIAGVILCLALAAGAYFFIKTQSPSYALAQTIKDIKKDGVQGLENHVTEDIKGTIDTMLLLSGNSLVSGILSKISESENVNDMKEVLLTKMSEIDWSVEDVMKGKKNADVKIAFRYQDQFSGTVSISMIKENREWKIDGIGIPQLN